MEIKWENINDWGQEISVRLGFNEDDDRFPPEERNQWVCCKEVYNIVWEAIKECCKSWNIINRPPHHVELSYAWEEKVPKKPFQCRRDFWDIFRRAKVEISDFYLENLGRLPELPEIHGAFRQAFTDPDFEFNYDLEFGTEEYSFENYERRQRSDDIELAKLVEIDKCVFCGEPVYVYCEDLLHNAGEIEMHFGYGSRRDTDYGEGYIHDICSAKLDQELFKKRLNWGGTFGQDEDHIVDIPSSEENGEIVWVDKEKIQSESYAQQLKELDMLNKEDVE